MSDVGPPSPPPRPPGSGPASRFEARSRPAWAGASTNPTTYPSRPIARVEEEILRADLQRLELEADMHRTGQANALVVAELTPLSVREGVCTTTTWIEGRITVLPKADTVTLYALPTSVDGPATQTTLRWDVLARVCGAGCWQLIPDLDPRRWITRRWPTPAEFEILAGLAISRN